MLETLEETDRRAGTAGLIEDLPLFSAHVRRPAPPPGPAMRADSALAERLAALVPDDITPRQALELVYELKALAQDTPER